MSTAGRESGVIMGYSFCGPQGRGIGDEGRGPTPDLMSTRLSSVLTVAETSMRTPGPPVLGGLTSGETHEMERYRPSCAGISIDLETIRSGVKSLVEGRCSDTR
jgi:hypothetical protein